MQICISEVKLLSTTWWSLQEGTDSLHQALTSRVNCPQASPPKLPLPYYLHVTELPIYRECLSRFFYKWIITCIMYEFYYFNSHRRIILSRFWRAIMRNKRKNVVLSDHHQQLALIQRHRSRSWGWFPANGQQRPWGRMQGPQSERPHSLWLRLNVKLLQALMDFPWVGMTISNRAKQIDPQGHGMPVSRPKEHTKLDKSELATRLTTATGLHTPAYRGSRCKERAWSLPVSVFALCWSTACHHLLSAMFSYRSFVGSAFCKRVSLFFLQFKNCLLCARF